MRRIWYNTCICVYEHIMHVLIHTFIISLCVWRVQQKKVSLLQWSVLISGMGGAWDTNNICTHMFPWNTCYDMKESFFSSSRHRSYLLYSCLMSQPIPIPNQPYLLQCTTCFLCIKYNLNMFCCIYLCCNNHSLSQPHHAALAQAHDSSSSYTGNNVRCNDLTY
jgi:hypothetical protein